jgi:hypothetical protein
VYLPPDPTQAICSCWRIGIGSCRCCSGICARHIGPCLRHDQISFSSYKRKQIHVGLHSTSLIYSQHEYFIMSIIPASISLYQQAFIQVAVLGLYQSADTIALFLTIRRQPCTSGTLIVLFTSALPFPALLVPVSLLFAVDSPASIAASWALALHLYLGCLRVRNVARVAPQRWHSCQISFVRGAWIAS